jgi:hypothetical protein
MHPGAPRARFPLILHGSVNMTNGQQEQRQAKRFTYICEARCETPGRLSIDRIIILSTTGAWIETSDPPAEGTILTLYFTAGLMDVTTQARGGLQAAGEGHGGSFSKPFTPTPKSDRGSLSQHLPLSLRPDSRSFIGRRASAIHCSENKRSPRAFGIGIGIGTRNRGSHEPIYQKSRFRYRPLDDKPLIFMRQRVRHRAHEGLLRNRLIGFLAFTEEHG